MKPHRITLLVIVVGFAASVGGFLADNFPGSRSCSGLSLTLVFAALLDLAVSRRDVALRLVQELEVKELPARRGPFPPSGDRAEPPAGAAHGGGRAARRRDRP